MSKLMIAAFDMAGQENCDTEEHDMIQELAERLNALENLVTKAANQFAFLSKPNFSMMLLGDLERLDK